jgi:hypothetical protein
MTLHDEIEAELERAAALPVPRQRFEAAQRLQKELQDVVPRCAEIKREALREERGYGYSLGDLAATYGLTRARIAQLLDG